MQETADLFAFTEETLNEKLHSLCSVVLNDLAAALRWTFLLSFFFFYGGCNGLMYFPNKIFTFSKTSVKIEHKKVVQASAVHIYKGVNLLNKVPTMVLQKRFLSFHCPLLETSMMKSVYVLSQDSHFTVKFVTKIKKQTFWVFG